MSHLALTGLQLFLFRGTVSLEGGFKYQNDKAHLSFISQCDHRELGRAETDRFLQLSKGNMVSFPACVHWEPTVFFWRIWWDSVTQSSSWLWGGRDRACLTYRSCNMKSLNLIAECWYLKPAQWGSDSQMSVWCKHFWQAICIFYELKIESWSLSGNSTE